MIARVKRIYLRENKKRKSFRIPSLSETAFRWNKFLEKTRKKIIVEKNKELTFYYVEDNCPSQNMNGNLALFPPLGFWKSKCGLGYMDLFGIQTAAEF